VTPPHELTVFFAGQAGAEGMFFSIWSGHLAIAGSTSTTGFASELLAGRRLEDLIDYIKSVADNPIVLIDLPPVLLTDEALLVAPRVDATLLVVAEGRTRRDCLVRAKALLTEFASAGVIFESVQRESRRARLRLRLRLREVEELIREGRDPLGTRQPQQKSKRPGHDGALYPR